MHDVLSNGRTFRSLTIVDDYSREAIAIEVDFSPTSERVIRVLSRLADDRGLPQTLKFDNGAEIHEQCDAGMGRPGKCRVALHRAWPADAERSVESFNGRFRDELLNESTHF